MPLSTSRFRWLKIVVCLIGFSQLAACSGVGDILPMGKDEETQELEALFEEQAPEQKAQSQEGEKQAILDAVIEEVPEAEGSQVLPLPLNDEPLSVYDWEVIPGGLMGNAFTGIANTHFSRPVAVAARSEYVYIVDEGLKEVLRYDMASQRLTTLLDLTSEVEGAVADIYVEKDFSFYITDTDGGRVLHYDRNAHLLQEYKNYFNLTKPVSVSVLPDGDVVVADGHFDHILRFTQAGELIAAHGGRGQEVAKFTNITAMAIGPDGYYVGARVGRKVQVMSMNGQYNYSFEEGGVIFPAAIVVDENNRAYVADLMDNQIKVFDRGRLVATMGRSGSAPGQFMRVTDMWLVESQLYIVDSLNGRIQVARLMPDSGSRGAETGFTPIIP